MEALFAMFDIGPVELMIVGVIAVLLFGERLPEVGRSLGKQIMEFKKGMQGIQNEISSVVSLSTREVSQPTKEVFHEEVDDYEEATAPKFEPPASQASPESHPVSQS